MMIYPPFYKKIVVYPSGVATFYSPSDSYRSRVGRMHYEWICAVVTWRKGLARHDCVFIETDPDSPGMCGLDIACVHLFSTFPYKSVKYSCALVHWFLHVGELADAGTGMWVVEPDGGEGKPMPTISS